MTGCAAMTKLKNAALFLPERGDRSSLFAARAAAGARSARRGGAGSTFRGAN
jgi:hypothetical protein